MFVYLNTFVIRFYLELEHQRLTKIQSISEES